MNKPWLAALAWAGALCSAQAQPAAALQPLPLPHFDQPAALARDCDQALAASRRELRQLERRRVDGAWLAAYDAFSARIEDRSAVPAFLLNAVHPDKAMRDASEACQLKWNAFSTALLQSPRLYQAVRRLPAADAIDREAQRSLLDGFEDAGVSLPPRQRAEAKRLQLKLGELSQAFERNVRDDNTKLAFTEAELEGVPAAAWAKAERDAEGRRLLGLDNPVAIPVVENALNPLTRERMWRAMQNQGGEANLQLLADITQLRQRYAALFGAPSYADFLARRRMAGSAARIESFLGEVQQAVQQRELQELQQLRQAKAEHLGQALEATQLERWDVRFYTERVRKARFSVNEEAMRPYLPPEPSLDFALKVVERMLGLRYQRIEAPGAWHPEVRAYAVLDAASGQRLSTLWVDLYPREGKYNHAAVWPLKGSSTLSGRPSAAALVVNFDRQGLTADELETLLHELGHAVHANVSRTRYVLHSGTSVKHDFVEAPSQMLEDWAYDPEVLKLFTEVCPACKPLPAELFAQAKRAREYGRGVQTARQRLYAQYDLTLHGPELQAPLPLWQRMEGATPLRSVPGTMFPAGFAHIATHYGAGYYGYLWSEVVAADLRTAFQGRRLDAEVGRRYREGVLAQGGQRPPLAMVKDFLGRDTDARAFFEELKR